MFWRTLSATKVYELCKTILLPEGLLISHNFDTPVQYIEKAHFQQKCFEGTTPMLNTNVNLVMKKMSLPLPIVKESWEEFTLKPNRGVFVYSMVPVIYSISILAVVTWFLTIFVLTNYTIKPSLLLRVSCVMALAYMLATVAKSIAILHDQQRQGFLHGRAVLDNLNAALYLNIIDMVVTLLLQINQVQVVMRLFLRQRDKRLIFYVGVVASISSQTLWAVTKFHDFTTDEEGGKILPAFTYLIRIAMGICYAAIFTAFLLTNIRIIIANRHIWLISALTFVFIYAPVAFFITDVSSTWVFELSEVFSVVTYTICVVLPWEWCNKFNQIRKIMEKEGVLGRRFHEDELYELDRFELFVEEEADTASSANNDSSESGNAASSNTRVESHDKLEPEPQIAPTTFGRFTNGFNVARDRFLDITDKIIATGLAIPRSVSIGSSFGGQNFHFERKTPDALANGHSLALEETENTGRNRRDVFVYSTRDVVIGDD